MTPVNPEHLITAATAVLVAAISFGPAWVLLWRRNNKDHRDTQDNLAGLARSSEAGLGLVLDILGEVREWQKRHAEDHARLRAEALAFIRANPTLDYPPDDLSELEETRP